MKSAAGYEFNGFTIPHRMASGLERWIQHGELPGSFLQAVLRNDLMDAVGRADAQNAANLPAYVGYLYNEAPAQCYGSQAKVDAWEAKFAAARAAALAAEEAECWPDNHGPLSNLPHDA